MAKQCPRCWEKVTPGVEVCPNCGYNFIRKTVSPENSEESAQKRKVIFPQAKKDYSTEDGTDLIYNIINWAIFIWVVLALFGGIWNLVGGEYLQGAGLLASGVLAFVAFRFMRVHEKHGVCWVITLISAAATLQIPTLLIGVGMSFLVFACKPYFNTPE